MYFCRIIKYKYNTIYSLLIHIYSRTSGSTTSKWIKMKKGICVICDRRVRIRSEMQRMFQSICDVLLLLIIHMFMSVSHVKINKKSEALMKVYPYSVLSPIKGKGENDTFFIRFCSTTARISSFFSSKIMQLLVFIPLRVLLFDCLVVDVYIFFQQTVH